MDGSAQKGERNWGRIALLASLAVNLLVVGTLIGATFGGAGHKHNRAKPPGMRALVNSLPDPLLHEYQDRSREAHRLFNQMVRNSAESDKIILKELRSDNFDSEEMHVAMGARSHAILEVLEDFHDVLIEIVEDMSPEEREAYADRVEEFQKNNRRRR